jgi:hypothetical protein
MDNKIKLLLSNKFIFENNVQGTMFNLMFQLYYKLINISKENYLNIFDNIIYVYPYFFSNEHITKKIQIIRKNVKFVKYNPMINFYRLNEIFKFYNLNSKLNKDSVITDIGYTPILLENIINNNYRIKNLNFIATSSGLLNFNIEDKKIRELIEKFTKFFSFNSSKFNDSNYNLIDFKDIKKSDLLYYNKYDYDNNFSYLDNYYNIINMFIGLLIGLKYVNIGGTFILNLNEVINKPIADIYLILKEYYTESNLYHPEICSHIKRSGTYGVFKGFKGISEEKFNELYKILEKIKEKYPNNIDDFNIYEPTLRKYFDVKKPIDNNNKPYITGFLDLSEDNDKYKEIIDFNDKKYIEHYLVLKKLENFLKTNPNSNINNKIKIPSQEQLAQSIMYCNKWGIEYYKTNDMIEGMNKEILNEMYGNINPIMFKFKAQPNDNKTKNKTTKNKTTKNKTKKSASKRSIYFIDLDENNLMENNDLFVINNIISQTGKMIDSRRDLSKKDEDRVQLENYYKGHDLFRFYKKTGSKYNIDLSYIVKNEINRNVSQAWLKFYEILTETNIIPKNRTKYKSFHLCEAPGSFIDCLDYYIKKETNITDFNWNAQSYKATKGKDYFGDDFGIIKAYPDHWHWGKDGTGDITKCDNIFSYKELCKDVDLITSDCGVPMNNPGYERTLFSSMVAITYLLPKGSNMIFKILTPIDTPIIWNIIYLWFSSFKELVFFKPIQNSFSREFYIIGKNFKGIDKNKIIMDKLLNLVKDQTNKFITTDLFNDTYPNNFIRQVFDISYKLANNWKYTIEKQIYYSDNMENINKEFIKLAENYIKEKNLDFIKKYKLYPLNKITKKQTKKQTNKETNKETNK